MAVVSIVVQNKFYSLVLDGSQRGESCHTLFADLSWAPSSVIVLWILASVPDAFVVKILRIGLAYCQEGLL